MYFLGAGSLWLLFALLSRWIDVTTATAEDISERGPTPNSSPSSSSSSSSLSHPIGPAGPPRPLPPIPSRATQWMQRLRRHRTRSRHSKKPSTVRRFFCQGQDPTSDTSVTLVPPAASSSVLPAATTDAAAAAPSQKLSLDATAATRTTISTEASLEEHPMDRDLDEKKDGEHTEARDEVRQPDEDDIDRIEPLPRAPETSFDVAPGKETSAVGAAVAPAPGGYVLHSRPYDPHRAREIELNQVAKEALQQETEERQQETIFVEWHVHGESLMEGMDRRQRSLNQLLGLRSRRALLKDRLSKTKDALRRVLRHEVPLSVEAFQRETEEDPELARADAWERRKDMWPGYRLDDFDMFYDDAMSTIPMEVRGRYSKRCPVGFIHDAFHIAAAYRDGFRDAERQAAAYTDAIRHLRSYRDPGWCFL